MFSIDIAKLVGFRLMSFITMSIFAISIYLCSLTTNYYSFLVLYAIVPGTMTGFGMTIPHYCIWKYFPEKSHIFGSILLISAFVSPVIPNIIIHFSMFYNNVDTELTWDPT